MKFFIKTPALFLIAFFSFVSCKKEIDPLANVPPFTKNQPPFARGGADQTITLPVNSVTIDGRESSDADGSITTYAWRQIGGPNQSIIGTPVQSTSVISNLIFGIYTFELKVNDKEGLSARDTVQIIVNSSTNIISNPSNRAVIKANLIACGTLSEARAGIAISSAGDKIVFAGGYNSVPSSRVDIYDTRTQKWTIASLSVARWNLAVSSIGTKIFFAGGIVQSPWDYGEIYPNVDIYDAAKDTWSVAYLNEGKEGLAAASDGNNIFFAGGNFFQNFSDKIEVYDAAAGLWVTSPSATLSEARSNLSAVTSGNKIYFSGGFTFQYPNFPSDKIDIYDVTSASWSTSKLSEPKNGHAAIAINNKIYWAGGINYTDPNNSPSNSSLVEIRDETTQTPSFACLFQPNSDFSAVVKNNTIVFFTGQGAIKNKFDIYDFASNTWSIGVMPHNVENSAIISVNNSIYIAGGNIDGILSDKVWKLDF